MADSVLKMSVYDDRIVQTQPKYAVEKGALSLTNAPFTALSQTASQHTYNISVPSEGVFIDRAVEWRSTCYLQLTALPNTPYSEDAPVCVLGRDVALSMFPLTTLVQTMTATINDATVTMNTGDVLHEVLRLTDYSKNRLQRTCPTMMDTYASYNDAFGTIRNPLSDFSTSLGRDEIPNGAWGQVRWTYPNGSPLPSSGASFYVSGGVTVNAQNGVPIQSQVSGAYPVGGYPLFLSFDSNEKLVLSPFIFSDIHEMDTGIFGVQNIQLVMNLTSPSLTSPIGRVLRTTDEIVTVSAVGYNAQASQNSGNPFSNSRVNVQFLTPSLSIPLPARSIVPYYEFPRYVSQQTLVNNAGGSGISLGQSAQVQSQTITLPCIPDLLIIYCKPNAYASTDGDWYLPITQISCNFDNFSGLLASHTAEELYGMSVNNGLEMDYNSWLGYAESAAAQGSNGVVPPAGQKVPLVGGFLVLKPSKDITLQEGQAPSVVGNYTFQFNATVNNWNPASVSSATLYVITANSGYFETIKGSSRVIKGVLNEADVINAPMAPAGTRSNLQRVVGGRGALHRLGNVLGRVKDFMSSHPAGGRPTGGSAPAPAVGGRRTGGLAQRLM